MIYDLKKIEHSEISNLNRGGYEYIQMHRHDLWFGDTLKAESFRGECLDLFVGDFFGSMVKVFTAVKAP